MTETMLLVYIFGLLLAIALLLLLISAKMDDRKKRD